MPDWFLEPPDWLSGSSYLGIVLFLALTGVGLPIPEEVPIVAAGIASKAGSLAWPWALLSCLVGAVVGDSIMYGIGRYFGAKVLREHPWWSGFLTPERERTIEELIQKHGIKAFFVARFLVGLRSPFYLTAGILRVKYRWFLLMDVLCASIVIGLFFGLGYLFGDRVTSLIQSAERGLTAVVLLVAAAAAVVAFFSFRQRRIRMLDQDPERLFENREILLGPAADRIADAVRLGDVEPSAAARHSDGGLARRASRSAAAPRDAARQDAARHDAVPRDDTRPPPA